MSMESPSCMSESLLAKVMAANLQTTAEEYLKTCSEVLKVTTRRGEPTSDTNWPPRCRRRPPSFDRSHIAAQPVNIKSTSNETCDPPDAC